MNSLEKLIIVDLRTWNWTGIGRVTKGIYDCVRELEKEFDILYIVDHDEIISGTNIIKFRSKPFSFSEQIEFYKLFTNFRHRQIILHSLNFNVPLKLPTNVTQICHFYDVLVSTGEFRTILHKLAYLIYIWRLQQNKAIILAQSDFTAEQIAKHHPFQEVIICPHGFNQYLQPFQIDVHTTYNITNSYFLYVGLNKPRKNLNGLLQEYKTALYSDPSIKYDLVVCGPIFDKTALGFDIKAFVESDNLLSERVHLLGFVSEHHLFSLYQNASLYVVPSDLESGFSYPALEALSCGTPVLLNKYDMYNYKSAEKEVYFFDSSQSEGSLSLGSVLRERLTDDVIERINPDTCDVLKKFEWERVKGVIKGIYSRK